MPYANSESYLASSGRSDQCGASDASATLVQGTAGRFCNLDQRGRRHRGPGTMLTRFVSRIDHELKLYSQPVVAWPSRRG
jgi:hypothetical protein